MSTQDNNNSFDWVYYILGIIAGMLFVGAITLHLGWILLGGIIGFIVGAIFLNGIVKGREY